VTDPLEPSLNVGRRQQSSATSPETTIMATLQTTTTTTQQQQQQQQHHFRKNAEIREWINTLSKRNSKLERLLSKKDKLSNANHQIKIKEEREAITKLIKQIITAVKQTQTENNSKKKKKKKGANEEDMEAMGKDFDAEFNRFRESCQKMETQEKKFLNHLDHENNNNSNHTDSLIGNNYQVQDTIDVNLLDFNEKEIAHRHQHITQIEEEVNDVLKMYQEMKYFVNQQEEGINRIEIHIQDTKVKTTDARHELLEAEKSQKKARQKHCCVLFLALAGITVVVLIAVLSTRS